MKQWFLLSIVSHCGTISLTTITKSVKIYILLKGRLLVTFYDTWRQKSFESVIFKYFSLTSSESQVDFAVKCGSLPFLLFHSLLPYFELTNIYVGSIYFAITVLLHPFYTSPWIEFPTISHKFNENCNSAVTISLKKMSKVQYLQLKSYIEVNVLENQPGRTNDIKSCPGICRRTKNAGKEPRCTMPLIKCIFKKNI